MEVKIIEDTVFCGKRITTVQLRYQRFIHSELLTHRALSRNSSSSRAIPVKKILRQVWKEPAEPLHWGENRPGMQAEAELKGWRLWSAKLIWRISGKLMCGAAWLMSKLGLHKQVANRLLEPWQFINTVVTATEWDNLFALRCHPDAQPEFQALAISIRAAMGASVPRDISKTHLTHNYWHIPYVSAEERLELSLETCLAVSAARCARVSYLGHDGVKAPVASDLSLYDRLVGSEPLHASPVEHQAMACDASTKSRNYVGWLQRREQIERFKNG